MKENLDEPLLKSEMQNYRSVSKLNNSSFMDQIMRIKPNEESLMRVKGHKKKVVKEIKYERTLTAGNLVRK